MKSFLTIHIDDFHYFTTVLGIFAAFYRYCVCNYNFWKTKSAQRRRMSERYSKIRVSSGATTSVFD